MLKMSTNCVLGYLLCSRTFLYAPLANNGCAHRDAASNTAALLDGNFDHPE
jgi:hypothetical protein